MKKFLWYNLEKLKNDLDYFIVSYISLILIQFNLYFSYFKNMNLVSSLIIGIVFSIFFIYISIMKKAFNYKKIIKNIFL